MHSTPRRAPRSEPPVAMLIPEPGGQVLVTTPSPARGTKPAVADVGALSFAPTSPTSSLPCGPAVTDPARFLLRLPARASGGEQWGPRPDTF